MGALSRRLDTVTSGALVLARDKHTAGLLARDFRLKRVVKYYVALSDRKPSKKMGSVVGDMQKGRRGSWMLARTCHNPAVTRFVSAAVPGRRPGLRGFVLRPETGQTHQLRVALKSLGAPVLGDGRYGQAERARLEDRGYLHCAAMRFQTPGGPVQVVCQPLEGLEFQSLEFNAVFSGWFPSGMVEQHGTWFEEHTLLRSSLLDHEDSRISWADPGKTA
ncbi:hypothetical protein N2152v2_006498 [Parachlorella kessleri]